MCRNKESNGIAKAHQPGWLNVTADSLSRHFEDGIEWELNCRLFGKIYGVFDVPQIDLFASRINHQTSTYDSWKRDPYASYMDAFSVLLTVTFSHPLSGWQIPLEAGSGGSISNRHCTTLDLTDMVHQPSESPWWVCPKSFD